MHEFADIALEIAETEQELRFMYRTGSISLCDAYENGIIDELGREYSNSTQLVCKYCGKSGLKWIKTDKGWRTSENNIVHKCSFFNKASNS